ncbi:hypothetical protein [Streptomyces sp. NPDC055506]
MVASIDGANRYLTDNVHIVEPTTGQVTITTGATGGQCADRPFRFIASADPAPGQPTRLGASRLPSQYVQATTRRTTDVRYHYELSQSGLLVPACSGHSHRIVRAARVTTAA